MAQRMNGLKSKQQQQTSAGSLEAMKTNRTDGRASRYPWTLLGCVLGAALLTTGCSSLLTGYNPSVLPPAYQEAFKVTARLFPVPDRVDYWQTPRETRERRKGDCEDFAFLLEDEARLRGVKATVQFGKAHVSNKTFHAWNETRTADGRRVVMDAFLGVWMVNPGPGYYVKVDLTKTASAVGFTVNELDYTIRRSEEEGKTLSTARVN
jgi:hypothetical protein